MSFWAFACMFSQRVNLSVAIVAMVKKHIKDQKEASQICFTSEYYKGNASFSEGNFDWGEKIQGHILGSFFYGYAITNVIGGPASHYFGARLVAGF
ncbi:Sialin, partial [Armadillidium nasatum]